MIYNEAWGNAKRGIPMAGEEMVNVVDMQSSFDAKAQQEIKPTAPYAILQTAGTKKDEPIAADNLIETQETKTGEKQITDEEKIKQADEFWAQHSRGEQGQTDCSRGKRQFH